MTKFAQPKASAKVNAQNLMGYAAVASGAVQTCRALYQNYKAKNTYTVEVSEADFLFFPLVEWLDNQNNAVGAILKHVEATTSQKEWNGDSIEGATREWMDRRLQLKYMSSDNTSQDVQYSGCKFKAAIISPDPTSMPMSRKDMARKIVFSSESVASYKSSKKLISDVRDSIKFEDKKARIFIRDNYNNWRLRSDLSLRSVDSVILPAGQMERIINTVGDFFDSEEEHHRRGIPWHLGCLFYGSPGTGKTSIAKAIAQHFKSDIYLVQLGDAKSDTSLVNLLADIPPKSILLLEDVDVFSAVKDRDAEAGALSMSGLLNSLDGLGTPDGLVLVLTTNDLDALDPAVIRPGRIDLLEHIDVMTDAQFNELFTFFYKQSPIKPLKAKGRTSADAMSVMKLYFDDPDSAEMCLHAF